MEENVTSLGEPFARGRSSEIYDWGEGLVLKLFVGWLPPEVAEEEAKRTQTARAAGLPVPDAREVVQVDGRPGVVFERLEGPSMQEVFWKRPWMLRRLAYRSADLHASMHAFAVPELVSLCEQTGQKIEQAEVLPVEMRRAILEILEGLPVDDKLCHLDFGPDNIKMTARGPVIMDWMIATRGNPWADVAKTSIVVSKETLPATAYNWLFKILSRLFCRVYLERYFQLCPGDRRQLAAWRPVMAAARLWERIPEENERLLALVKRGISTSM